MKFTKHDYDQQQQKKKHALALLGVGVVIVMIILFFATHRNNQPIDNHSSPQTTPDPTNPRNPNLGGGSTTPTASRTSSAVKDVPTIFAEAKRSIVWVKTYDRKNQLIGTGSGFFIEETGIMVSNRHVFQSAHEAHIVNSAGSKFVVKKVLAEHSNYDLVRLQVGIGKTKTPPLTLSTVLPRVGEKILVIGNPMNFDFTITDGIVSAIRDVPPFGQVIQISSPISPGSSGSPVLNMKGEVIGVATFQYAVGQNLNFAVPISRLQNLTLIAGTDGDLSTINFSGGDAVSAAEHPFDKGMILFSQNDYRNAAPYFKQALKDSPDNAEAWLHLGICYSKEGLTDAVDAFKKVLTINPQSAEAYMHMGITYYTLNQPLEAIKALKESLALRPDYNEAMMHLGIAYSINKNNEAAVKALERSIDLFPDARAYYYLGASYFHLKKYDKAIRPLMRALEQDADFLNAYLALGSCYVAMQYWSRGIKVMNEAVIIAPENAEVHYILGMLHVGNEDLESARRESAILNADRNADKYASNLRSAISRLEYNQRYNRR